MIEPELDELYDDATLAALDAWGRDRRPVRASGVRGRAAAGAVVASLALGVRVDVEPRQPSPVVIEVE